MYIYYQMFRQDKYIAMTPVMSVMEMDILLLEWFKEYEKQKLHMRDHVAIAIEKRIKMVAREMGLRVGGQLPTGMHDVISI
jgi:hypothetical protein